jgi:tetratricopeptide (TPR) repeat protein
MTGRVRWRRVVMLGAIIAASAGTALAQPTPLKKPKLKPKQPNPTATLGAPTPAPAPPPRIASPLTAVPRAVISPDAVPDLPDVAPDRFAVMAFENHTAYESLDYLIAGAPFALAEKVEAAVGLQPAYGPLVVSPPVVPGMPTTVAPFAATNGARWVFTGWFERPNWELRLVVTLWKVEAGVATKAGEVKRLGPFTELHRFLGDVIGELAPVAGWPLPDPAALAYKPSIDTYSFTLFGRGLGHLVGTASAGVNLKAALHDLERATFIDPKMVEAQRVLGELLATSPEPRTVARASGKFSYAIDLQPMYAAGLAAAANVARNAGKDEIALELYRRLLGRRPWDLDARFRIGEALWKTGDPKRAVVELERVARRRPDDLATRRVLALIHAERGETQKLIAELEAIAQRAPADLEVKLDLAGAYAALAQWEPALAAYQEVARARPLDVTLAKRIGDVERWKGDPRASDDWYRRARELAPDDPRAYYGAAASWLERNDLDSAHHVLISAQRFKDHLGATYHALGVVQLRRGHRDEAAWYLRRAARFQPRKVGTRVAVVAAELARNDRLAAERQLAFALPAWPDDPDLVYLDGVVRSLAGDRAGARTRIARVLELDKDHAPARAALAALDAGGEIKAALAPTIDLPFGDARALAGAIERFTSIDSQLEILRGQVQHLGLAILSRLGEGPMKQKPRRGVARPRRAGCPIADVVRPWQAAQRGLTAFYRVGVQLEDVHRMLARHDVLGEASGLLPDQRTRLIAARKGYRLDLADVRELRAMWTAVSRELKAHGCSAALLAAAAADPGRYTVRVQPKEVVATQTRKPRVPSRESFFVDNRDCPEALTVFIDGEEVGNVPGGERSALIAEAGQRTLCLIGKGHAACGDRGTVRQIYLHEGWEVEMKCPK